MLRNRVREGRIKLVALEEDWLSVQLTVFFVKRRVEHSIAERKPCEEESRPHSPAAEFRECSRWAASPLQQG